MKPPRIARFLGVFCLVFVILTWPGLPFASTYMSVFRAVGAFVFTHEGGEREVLFVESPRASESATMARIEIVNRSLVLAEPIGGNRVGGTLTWNIYAPVKPGVPITNIGVSTTTSVSAGGMLFFGANSGVSWKPKK